MQGPVIRQLAPEQIPPSLRPPSISRASPEVIAERKVAVLKLDSATSRLERIQQQMLQPGIPSNEKEFLLRQQTAAQSEVKSAEASLAGVDARPQQSIGPQLSVDELLEWARFLIPTLFQ